MDRRPFTLILGLCVALDLASPFVPGAFCFEADRSIDTISSPVARGTRPEGIWAPTSGPVADHDGGRAVSAMILPQRRTTGRSQDEWTGELRRDRAPASSSASSSDDH